LSESRDASARRLLLVGNSVSLPPAPGVEAYPDRLRARLGSGWVLTTIIRSGATIEEMESDIVESVGAIRPHAVILQVGINECAPRPLAPAGRRRLGAVRPMWLRGAIVGAIHRWRPEIIRLRGLAQFTPLDRFSAVLARVTAAARGVGAAMMVLPITEVTTVAEARTPFTNREVARYNHALRALGGNGVTYVDSAALLPGLGPADYCLAPETVHWNSATHERVAEFLQAWLVSVA
jgi:hypothetical protein